MVGVALALVGFSAFDAFATIQLLSMGCEEANPVMLQLLRLGTLVFMIGKFGLTIAGVSVLLGFRYHALFSSPLRVGHFLLGLGGVYLALVVYELVLLGTLSTA